LFQKKKLHRSSNIYDMSIDFALLNSDAKPKICGKEMHEYEVFHIRWNHRQLIPHSLKCSNNQELIVKSEKQHITKYFHIQYLKLKEYMQEIID